MSLYFVHEYENFMTVSMNYFKAHLFHKQNNTIPKTLSLCVNVNAQSQFSQRAKHTPKRGHQPTETKQGTHNLIKPPPLLLSLSFLLSK
jgi:hypothetical protein